MALFIATKYFFLYFTWTIMAGWIAWLFIAVTWLELIYHFDKENDRLKNIVLIAHICVVGVVAGLISYYIVIFSQLQILGFPLDNNKGLFQ